MESLLLSKQPDRYQANRRVTRAETDPVTHKHQYVLALHLAGRKPHEIQLETGYSIPRIYSILKEPNVVALRQQLLSSVSDEFEALFSKAVDVIRDGLDSPDPKVRLDVCKEFMKAHPKFTKGKKTDDVTAEDVVAKILNIGGTVNVQVNG